MKRPIAASVLALNISLRCNMACTRCFGHLDAFGAPQVMDVETAKRSTELFLSQLPARECYLLLFGGEPLLNWDLVEEFIPWFTDRSRPHGVSKLISTNGLALSRERIDFLARYEVNILLSLDGDYAEYHKTRPISAQQYEYVVGMLQYGLTHGPEFVAPYCVLRKENIPATYEILSYLVSLGARKLYLSKDQFEDWTEDDRVQAAKLANAVVRDFGVSITPEVEGTFDCVTCHPRSIMIYPNGDIYDGCYPFAALLHRRGLITEDDCQTMYLGNLDSVERLYMDVDKKRDLMQPRTNCSLIHRDINVTLKRLREGTNNEALPVPAHSMSALSGPATRTGQTGWLRWAWRRLPPEARRVMKAALGRS